MKSIDVRIVFDRDLGELEAERVGRVYARAVEKAVIDERLPRSVQTSGTRHVRVQDVRLAPRARRT